MPWKCSTPLNSRIPTLINASSSQWTLSIALYRVVPNDRGLQVLAYFLEKHQVLEPPTSTLTRLAELILTDTSNTFSLQRVQNATAILTGEASYFRIL